MALAMPAQALSPGTSAIAQQAQEEPAVVIEDGEGTPEDVAWTFRFLVPTLMALTVLLVVGLIVWYQRGFNKRYRVSE